MSQNNKQTPLPPPNGQALVEYSLILVLVILGFGFALAATGPTIANVFENTVFNLVSRETTKVPLNDKGTRISPPDVEDFWETVTAVAMIIPQEVPLPTSTRPIPTVTPSPGSPPPPTKTLTPSPTVPTNTPTSTPTPPDIHRLVPWYDSADSKADWRLDTIDPLGPEDWYAKYYNGTDLAGSPFLQGYISILTESPKKSNISFDWQDVGPGSGNPVDNFSATWTRNIRLEKNMQMTFSIPSVDDGIRIYILGGHYGSDIATCTTRYKGNGSWVLVDDAAVGYNPITGGNNIPSDCLIADNWNGGGGTGKFVTRTIKGGTKDTPAYYTIRVDYQEKTGKAKANVTISNNSNSASPDDALIDGSGNKIADANANCDWGNPTGLEKWADTADKLWTPYTPDSWFKGAKRCYLEFRGSIELLATELDKPNEKMVLNFWDVWDFQTGTTAWVEIAEYNTDRTVLAWERAEAGTINGTTAFLHANDTFNYNWTYQTVVIPDKYIGKKIALRFGIENRTTAPSRWWIDTLSIKGVERKEFTTLINHAENVRGWSLNTDVQKSDFIATGSWGLTSENAIGDGMAWHESPGAGVNYNKMNNQRPISDTRKYRIHSLEFNGYINLDGATTDIEGDTGDPELVFYQTYELATLTGLEVQYTTDPYSSGDGANWKPLTIIVPKENTDTKKLNLTTAEERRINLKPVGEAVFALNGTRKFRLRFAMLVDYNSATGKGWWIDDISIQRVDRPRFTAYPFIDTMETPASDVAWQSLGSWARVPDGQNAPVGSTGYSFTDSPPDADGKEVFYQNNEKSVLELRYPLDLRSDTTKNPRSQTCTLTDKDGNDACEAQRDPAAVNPMLTFWWKHDLGSGDDFIVEWKLKSEGAAGWRTLWIYKDGMQTVGTGTRTSTRNSKNWERVEIDMRPITQSLANNAGDDSEDDIVIRLNLTSDGGSNGPGVWVDNLDIRDRLEMVWYMWPTGQTRNDSTGALIKKTDLQGNVTTTDAQGSGTHYTNSGEDINVFPPEWHIGGGWTPINWEIHDGLNAFHDSAVAANGSTQSKAEVGFDNPPLVDTRGDTFNVLELNTIFDLRGTNANERPMMYFWSRYRIGSGARISVQISREKSPAPVVGGTGLCRNSLQQCYEKMYAWGEWETVWTVSNNKANFAWNREQINLVPYAKNGTTAGSRIRIRFVSDNLDSNGTDEDGWYLDQFSVTFYTENRFPVSDIGSSQVFTDFSTTMANWVAEGEWGLDPELYYGGGGMPVSLGPSWNVNYWTFAGTAGDNRCKALNSGWNNTNKFPDCIRSFFEPSGNDTKRARSYIHPTNPALNSIHRPNTTGINRDSAGVEIEIFHEWGASGPFGYTNAFAGRWELVTNVIGTPGTTKGNVTFIMASDDGGRLKYMNEQPNGATVATTACAGATSTCTAANGWNIIDNFYPAHGRIVNVGAAVLAVAGAGGNNNTTGRYRFILEYYDKDGDATITLATGTETFSFSDTPKQGPGKSFPDIPSIRRASSSLILNGVLDLTNATAPYMTYRTYYELGGYARVEVTIDGGFTWTDSGLRGKIPASKWQSVTYPTPIGATKDWYVQTWNDTDLDYTGEVAPKYKTVTTAIDYIWSKDMSSGSPKPAPVINPTGNITNASARFTRSITLTTLDVLRIQTRSDDGVRVWIYRKNDASPNTGSGCRIAFAVNGQPFLRSGHPKTNNQWVNTTSDGCLMIDNWQGQSATTNEVEFTPSVNDTYIIQVDYFQGGGDSSLKVDISTGNYELPTFTGVHMPDLPWEIRRHDLSDYAGQRIGLRFRLDRLGSLDDNTASPNVKTNTPVNYLVSWWLTEISVYPNSN